MTKHRLVNLLDNAVKNPSISWSVGLAEDIFARAVCLLTEFRCEDVGGGGGGAMKVINGKEGGSLHHVNPIQTGGAFEARADFELL